MVNNAIDASERRSRETDPGFPMQSARASGNHHARAKGLYEDMQLDFIADLKRVEHQISQVIGSHNRFVSEVIGHLAGAGGKRIRPFLVLSAAQAIHGQKAAPDRVITAAVAVELMHLGSLYHDDVIDNAGRRRGVLSVNTRWDNVMAVLGGDILLALSCRAAVSLGKEEARIISETLERLCTGEALELAQRFDLSRTEEDYFESIDGKTAVLLSASCQLGALESGANPSEVEALGDYGYHLGRAFQIVDDIIDLTGSADRLGKPVGQDIREGVYTLPVLLALSASPELASLLRETMSPEDKEAACRAFSDSCGLAAAKDRARLEVVSAIEALPPTLREVEHLRDMAAVVLDPIATDRMWREEAAFLVDRVATETSKFSDASIRTSR